VPKKEEKEELDFRQTSVQFRTNMLF